MNPVLEGKDPVALDAMRATLGVVDVIFEALLDQIKTQAEEIERRRAVRGFDGAPPFGELMRLVIQKQTIEALRTGIPDAIIDGDPRGISRIVNVV